MEKPLPPTPPGPTDCCGTGCIPCVHDLYEEALDDYEAKLIAWQQAVVAQRAGGTQAA